MEICLPKITGWVHLKTLIIYTPETRDLSRRGPSGEVVDVYLKVHQHEIVWGFPLNISILNRQLCLMILINIWSILQELLKISGIDFYELKCFLYIWYWIPLKRFLNKFFKFFPPFTATRIRKRSFLHKMLCLVRRTLRGLRRMRFFFWAYADWF